MGKQFDELDDTHRGFIERQKLFFVASAAPTGRVNVSPKGMQSFRVLSPTRVAYLDLTGSGNETSAHVETCADGRLTIMFCAVEGVPLILRLYGRGTIHRRGSARYSELLPGFTDIAGARQIVQLDVDRVQTSCGYAVPLFEFREERTGLVRWAESKGDQGLEDYRREANVLSIDGLPTGWPPNDEAAGPALPGPD
jgi:hypothetical protein